VAVERSGQAGPQLGLRKMSDATDAGPDGAGSTDTKTTSDQPSTGNLHANGSIPTYNGSSKPPLTGLEEEDSTVEEGVSSQKAEDVGPGDRTTGAADAPGDLGNVLKGSPFEPIPSSGTVPAVSRPSETVDKGSANAEKEKDKPKPSPFANGKLPTHIKSRPSVKPASVKPSAITTKTEPQPHKSNAAPLSSQSNKSAKPITPKTPTMQSQQSGSKATSPVVTQSKAAVSKPSVPVEKPNKNNAQEVEKQPTKKPSRASLATQGPRAEAKPRQPVVSTSQPTKRAAPVTASKHPPSTNSTSVSSQVKTSAPSSPNSSKRPHPKSPTRPVPLPASATAPTAASAAKLGGNAPSRSPSRASTVGAGIERKLSTLKKDRPSAVTRAPPSALAPGLQKKASRPSLPTGSQAGDRPKSRASTAADDSFLARMMRPTTSSAMKTHEKVETKSPPRKTHHATKPKRKSEASAESKSKGQEDEPVPPLPTASAATEQVGQDGGANKGEDTGEAGGSSVEPSAA
jgi:hypothetical protein